MRCSWARSARRSPPPTSPSSAWKPPTSRTNPQRRRLASTSTNINRALRNAHASARPSAVAATIRHDKIVCSLSLGSCRIGPGLGAGAEILLRRRPRRIDDERPRGTSRDDQYQRLVAQRFLLVNGSGCHRQKVARSDLRPLVATRPPRKSCAPAHHKDATHAVAVMVPARHATGRRGHKTHPELGSRCPLLRLNGCLTPHVGGLRRRHCALGRADDTYSSHAMSSSPLLMSRVIAHGGADIPVRASRQECRPHQLGWLRPPHRHQLSTDSASGKRTSPRDDVARASPMPASTQYPKSAHHSAFTPPAAARAGATARAAPHPDSRSRCLPRRSPPPPASRNTRRDRNHPASRWPAATACENESSDLSSARARAAQAAERCRAPRRPYTRRWPAHPRDAPLPTGSSRPCGRAPSRKTADHQSRNGTRNCA